MSKDHSGDAKTEKPRRFWRWFKRVFLTVLILFLVAVVLGWIFLPQIAERVIRAKIADAGLAGSELRVAEVGWRNATIEEVTLSGENWQIDAKAVEVHYDIADLLSGTIQAINLVDAAVVVSLPAEGAGEDDRKDQPDPAAKTATGEKRTEPYWYTTVADSLNQIGEIKAEAVNLTINRGERSWNESVDLLVNGGGKSHPVVSLQAQSFSLHAMLQTTRDSAEWKCDAKVLAPQEFLNLVELAIDFEGELLPEGISLTGATLAHTFRAEDGMIKPFQIDGLLAGVSYDGGTKPAQMSCKPDVLMSLTIQPSGAGQIVFSGELDSVSLPLDPSADFELKLRQDTAPGIKVRVAWGDEPTRVSGAVENMALAGAYNGKPVDLESIGMAFELLDGRLEVDAGFSNGGVKVPVNYGHIMSEEGSEWLMHGELDLGPFVQKGNLPMLAAFVDVFDDVDIAGASKAKVKFSVGSQQTFRATMEAALSDAEVSVQGGKVIASGVGGVYQLFIIPLADDDPGRIDPSYYTFDFRAKKLMIDSKEALDFDLVHQSDQPVKVTGKGNLGMDTSVITGEMKNLHLHGEKDDAELDLADTGLSFELNGDRLTLSGKTMVGGNPVPFTYRHMRKDVGEEWELDGVFEIADADLKEPVANAVMFVEAMEGKTIAGKVSMKLDFSLGSQKDFDGVMEAGVRGGNLSFGEDGPVIEGIVGDIRLESMKTKSTKGFHRVTASKMKAFDTEFKNLRLDYQLLPNGDIPLRNVAVNALGGMIWLDPFTLPGGDDDYKFKVRAKRLDVARLAKLFPDFNGSISGRIDGLLPLESKDGEISPRAGGMYLTPRTKGKLRYDAGNKFSAGLNPKSEEYKRMKMVEESLRNLDLEVLSIRLFDPRDKDKAIVLKLRGQAHNVPGSPPIHLNINGFKPDDDTVDFFDLLLKHRDRLDFGL